MLLLSYAGEQISQAALERPATVSALEELVTKVRHAGVEHSDIWLHDGAERNFLDDQGRFMLIDFDQARLVTTAKAKPKGQVRVQEYDRAPLEEKADNTNRIGGSVDQVATEPGAGKGTSCKRAWQVADDDAVKGIKATSAVEGKRVCSLHH